MPNSTGRLPLLSSINIGRYALPRHLILPLWSDNGASFTPHILCVSYIVTHKMSMIMSFPYEVFGELLTELRQKAGIASQAEFAALVKSKQQTVSRWEAGQSRPRDKQIPL